MVASHAQCIAEMQADRHAEAYAAATSAVQPFVKVNAASQESLTAAYVCANSIHLGLLRKRSAAGSAPSSPTPDWPENN